MLYTFGLNDIINNNKLLNNFINNPNNLIKYFSENGIIISNDNNIFKIVAYKLKDNIIYIILKIHNINNKIIPSNTHIFYYNFKYYFIRSDNVFSDNNEINFAFNLSQIYRYIRDYDEENDINEFGYINYNNINKFYYLLLCQN
ncbi:hypothetical protein LY90DRAFT_509870 [Neocallimastix californiae]|uniref:Uncharacterized protein n=1 Tax=Neocallimastix californiae TaxID=1754190 RepID=A0A1Y2C872_9FUNG|nr:hypothetical protein LY90DRAFT_509870 [Neocallimastix californiae]|eukprot:ORY43231.1 hypothetical protein LY90DRAFT_509870 [Neocallimastix californiae]